MKANVSLKSLSDCSGCGLCANLCPAAAISMDWNEDGFLVPRVNELQCVHCGICLVKCPVELQKSVVNRGLTPSQAYGAWNMDASLHEQSSSGGVFSAVAQWVLSKDGCVFGVVWEDKEHAIFAKAETVDELQAMRGSKYVQAEPRNVYRSVGEELRKGRYVLFAGTACQVEALNRFLRKNYERLLTIDIVCHGMPSRLLYQKYIHEKEAIAGQCIKRVTFRDKPEGWNKYHVTCHFAGGDKDSAPLTSDSYMRLFLCDKGLKEICYDCPYIRYSRPGDITLGDFWGVENHHPEWPIHLGVSAVLASSEKGEKILRELEKMRKIELHPELLQHMIPYQGGFKRHSPQPPSDRRAFLDAIRRLSLPQMEYLFLDSLVVCGFVRIRRNGKLHHLYLKLLNFWRRARGYVLVKSGLVR